MPGKKDYVTMVVDNLKQKIKKQILCTVYEAFILFKEENPTVKIGFSKYAEARPQNVVLPGVTGTHNVCVCSHHQNPKLMIANSGTDKKAAFKKLVGICTGDMYHGEIKYQHII